MHTHHAPVFSESKHVICAAGEVVKFPFGQCEHGVPFIVCGVHQGLAPWVCKTRYGGIENDKDGGEDGCNQDQ